MRLQASGKTKHSLGSSIKRKKGASEMGSLSPSFAHVEPMSQIIFSAAQLHFAEIKHSDWPFKVPCQFLTDQNALFERIVALLNIVYDISSWILH